MSSVVTDWFKYEHGGYRRIGQYLEFKCSGPVLNLPTQYDYILSNSSIRYLEGNFLGTVAVKGWETKSIQYNGTQEYIAIKYVKCYLDSTNTFRGGIKVQDTHSFYNDGEIVLPVTGYLTTKISGSVESDCQSIDLCVSINRGFYKKVAQMSYPPSSYGSRIYNFDYRNPDLVAGDIVEFKIAPTRKFELDDSYISEISAEIVRLSEDLTEIQKLERRVSRLERLR